MSGELEVKAVAVGRPLPVDRVLALAGAELGLLGEPRSVHLDARYHDDEAGRLRAGRWTLRARASDGVLVGTVKGPGPRIGGVQRRLEIDVPLDQLPEPGEPLPAPLAEALAAVLPEGLWPPFGHRVLVDRTQVDVRIPGGVAELAIDHGEVRAAGRTTPVRELELELKQGEGTQLFAAARRLAEPLGLRPGGLGKGARGLALRGLLGSRGARGQSRTERLETLAELDDRIELEPIDLRAERAELLASLIEDGAPPGLQRLAPDSTEYAALLWAALSA